MRSESEFEIFLFNNLQALMGEQLYANLERVVMCFKFLLFICVSILMIVIKTGGMMSLIIRYLATDLNLRSGSRFGVTESCSKE